MALAAVYAHLSLRSCFQKEGAAREEPTNAAVRGRVARPRPWPSNPRMRRALPLPPRAAARLRSPLPIMSL